MAWTNLDYAFGSVLTSTKMTQNQANFAALAAGDSGAPTIQGSAAITTLFGEWASRTNSTSYVASYDLIVTAFTLLLAGEDLAGYTDASNPPTTVRQRGSVAVGDSQADISISFPARKGDRYSVGTDASGGLDGYFITPIGI